MANLDKFQLLWAKIERKLDTTAEGRCWLWVGGKTTARCGVQYGMIRVWYPGASRSKTVHVGRAVYMVKTRNMDLPANHDVSHLCGRSLCANPDHLSLEPHSVNNTRIHCHGSRRCGGHGQYRDCMFL